MTVVVHSPETFTISAGATMELRTMFDGGADVGPLWTMAAPDGSEPVAAFLTTFDHSKCYRFPEGTRSESGGSTPAVFYVCKVRNRGKEPVSFHLEFFLLDSSKG